jgi:hypothetical protein
LNKKKLKLKIIYQLGMNSQKHLKYCHHLISVNRRILFSNCLNNMLADQKTRILTPQQDSK